MKDVLSSANTPPPTRDPSFIARPLSTISNTSLSADSPFIRPDTRLTPPDTPLCALLSAPTNTPSIVYAILSKVGLTLSGIFPGIPSNAYPDAPTDTCSTPPDKPPSAPLDSCPDTCPTPLDNPPGAPLDIRLDIYPIPPDNPPSASLNTRPDTRPTLPDNPTSAPLDIYPDTCPTPPNTPFDILSSASLKTPPDNMLKPIFTLELSDLGEYLILRL